MKHIYITLTMVLLLSVVNTLNAQEASEMEKKGTEEKFTPHSTLALMISHAHVFSGLDENGKKQVLALPSWAIDYNYRFSPKWSVGLHTDIILETFKVESHEGTEYERSHPIASAVMATFKPTRHWGFMAGAGGEFAKEENFFLTRLGIEYSAEIDKNWEVFGALTYDLKWNGYDSWVLGLGISRRL